MDLFDMHVDRNGDDLARAEDQKSAHREALAEIGRVLDGLAIG